MDNFLKKAEESFKNSNYKMAIKYCNKLITKGIFLKDAYCLKAHSEFCLSEYKDDKILSDALKDINLAIENANNDDWLFYIKSCILKKMKRQEDSLVEINKALFFKKEAFYYVARGIINQSIERNKEALNDYSLAIQMRDDADSYNYRSNLYINMGNYQLAREDAQKAVKLDVRSAAAWETLGKVLYKLDLFESSVSAYNESIKIEPDDFVYYRMSLSQKQLNNYTEAMESINKAIEIDDEYSDYYSQRGRLYFDWIEENKSLQNSDLTSEISYYANNKKTERQLRLAEEDFKKAIKLDDENDEAYWGIYNICEYIYDYERQIEVLKKLEELNPEDADIYQARGYTEMKLDNNKTAVKFFSKHLQYEPDNAKTYSLRALCYSELGEHQKALADSDKAIELCPSADYYTNRANCFLKLGKYQKALADSDKAIELWPSAYSYINRGNVKTYFLDELAALKDYNTAVKLSPDDDYAYFNRGILKADMGRHAAALTDYFKAYDNAKKYNKKIDTENYVEKFCKSLNWFLEEGDCKKTISLCKKIINLGFRHEKIYNCRCYAEIMLGELDKALTDCRMANKINPNYEPALENLKTIHHLKKRENDYFQF